MVYVTEALTYLIVLSKTKFHHAWKKDIMLVYVYNVSRRACEVNLQTEFCESSGTHYFLGQFWIKNEAVLIFVGNFSYPVLPSGQ